MRIWLAALAFLGTATVAVDVVSAFPGLSEVDGRRTNVQQLTTWDGVYTTTQADRGEKLYTDRCARCHGDALPGVEAAPALAGPAFYGNWDGETLDALFQRMRTSMPQDRPASLTRAENADVLAYMLRVAKYPAGMEPLDGQGGALTRIRVLMYRPQP